MALNFKELCGNNEHISAKFVIVGGGIAGVSCCEQLAIDIPDSNLLLISASQLVKATVNVKKYSHVLEEFEVQEKMFLELEEQHPNVHILVATVLGLNSQKHEIYLSTNQTVIYEKLCICTGAIPKSICNENPYVLNIRDTETVQVFQKKLSDAIRIVVIGNGGIATELVHDIEHCQVIWAIKDRSIGATFFDAGTAEFFLPHLNEEKLKDNASYVKRIKYTVENVNKEPTKECLGSALGPDWSHALSLQGKVKGKHDIHVEFCCEVEAVYLYDEFLKLPFKETQLDSQIFKEQWPVYVKLTNGTVFGCDFIVSATGVEPNTRPFLSGNEFSVALDGGICVDSEMRTSIGDVYAAGDACTASWDLSKHWFQMRLWTQARQMGLYAAKCMNAHVCEEMPILDICFDLFTHVTHFFGYKVVLLGLFNGQKLSKDYELLLRVSKREEYVKIVLQKGYVQGAILIGETDLEETFENLILNQLDVSAFKEHLLDPGIDIEDFFD